MIIYEKDIASNDFYNFLRISCVIMLVSCGDHDDEANKRFKLNVSENIQIEYTEATAVGIRQR